MNLAAKAKVRRWLSCLPSLKLPGRGSWAWGDCRERKGTWEKWVPSLPAVLGPLPILSQGWPKQLGGNISTPPPSQLPLGWPSTKVKLLLVQLGRHKCSSAKIMGWHSPISYGARVEEGTLPQGAVALVNLPAIGHTHFFPLISTSSTHVHQCHPMLEVAMTPANPSALPLYVVIVASNLGFAAGINK